MMWDPAGFFLKRRARGRDRAGLRTSTWEK